MTGIDDRWAVEIHGVEAGKYNNNYTFLGALSYCYKYISSKHWKNEKTRKQNMQLYNNKILPSIKDHNSKCIWQLTKEDYEDAINTIREKGFIKNGKQCYYAESTIRNFQFLIYIVVFHAAVFQLCDDVLWGTDFVLRKEKPDDSETDDITEEKIVLKKSLTVKQEKDLFQALTEDIRMDGAAVGLLLMFGLGLRNAEACGLNYGDIKPLRNHKDCNVAWIYKSTMIGTNELQAGGKTINSGRIIPVPERIYRFLYRRKMCILRILQDHPDIKQKEEYDINNMPICCDGSIGADLKIFIKRCSANNLSSIAPPYFEKAKITSKQIAYIDAELSDTGTAKILKEKDAKAYLLRRNYATHLQILGLSTAEIQYLIGHDVEDAYESRNEFVNEERLYEMHRKLLYRPLVNDSNTSNETQISVKPDTICKVRIVANEPFEPIQVKLSVPDDEQKITAKVFTEGQPTKTIRQVNILEEYRKAYS